MKIVNTQMMIIEDKTKKIKYHTFNIEEAGSFYKEDHRDKCTCLCHLLCKNSPACLVFCLSYPLSYSRHVFRMSALNAESTCPLAALWVLLFRRLFSPEDMLNQHALHVLLRLEKGGRMFPVQCFAWGEHVTMLCHRKLYNVWQLSWDHFLDVCIIE